MDLDFRVLDPNDPATDPALLEGWVNAVNRGFHLVRATDKSAETWLEQVRADRARLRGAWLPEGSFGAGPLPVATVTTFTGQVNVGGGEFCDLHMITDVTVSPAQRRQGLARKLLTEELAAAVEDGLPLAALTVSEGSIYRRFGFGPATFKAHYEIDVEVGFAIEAPRAGGRCVHMEPEAMWPVVEDLFGRWHLAQRGSVSRPHIYEQISRGEWDWNAQSDQPRLRGVVRLDADEQPDGYALYEHGGWGTDHTVTVHDMIGLSPDAYLGLWEFLAGVDLTDRVRAVGHVDDPLRWAVTNPRSVKQTKVADQIWLRVLDVPVALAARPWFGDGEVVIGIDDPQGHAAGAWRVTVTDGHAKVVRTDEQPGVEMHVSTLGSLYLGAVDVKTLAIAGRVTGAPEAVAAWAAMADGGGRPMSRTSF